MFTKESCFLISLFTCLCLSSQAKVNPPAPYGPTPSARQLAWHETGYYAFICLSTATYRDVEWGYGDASPDEFQPIKFNPRQWAEVVKAAGMKGMVLTAKHHDGFCLWPSKLTDYSVASSSWRGGKGDIVGELAREAKRAGLRFGVYLSPWDRHEMTYGTPAYLDYFRGQLKELLTWYGPIFEVWQDGANGGDGYYNGLREKRIVDGKTYYDWATTDTLIRKLQPMACIFGDGGPDARWCGNEVGMAGDPNWATLQKDNYTPGIADINGLQHGDKGGSHWVPSEVDVSIRPGWFYHESEDDKVKTVEQLMNIYYCSVGRGANLILNAPPTKEGLIHPIDSARLVEFGKALKREFSNPLKKSMVRHITATNVRGNSKKFGAQHVIDGKRTTYWATDDNVRKASVTIELKNPQQLFRIRLREPIQLGQRIEKFSIEAMTTEGEWQKIESGTTIGPQRILRLPDITATSVRVTVESSATCPLLSEIQLYLPY